MLDSWNDGFKENRNLNEYYLIEILVLMAYFYRINKKQVAEEYH
jgi:hypothetical protein